MAQQRKGGKPQNMEPQMTADESKKAGRGGARPGAGRKSGSGAFGEATVPMRIPMSLASQIEKALEDFKQVVSDRKSQTDAIAPLDLSALNDQALKLTGVDPSGRPVDLAKLMAKNPESCYAWTLDKALPKRGLQMGDIVIVDRSAKASGNALLAVWSESGLILVESHDQTKSSTGAWGVAVAVARML